LPHVPAAPLTATVLVTAGLVLLPLQASPQLMTSLRIGAPAESVVTTSAMTYLLLLGVIGSGVSTMAYIWLVLKRGPLFAGMTTYVVPVIALLWGTLDREAISSQQALAIAGVLGMVALVQSGSKVEEETLVPALTTEAMALLPLPVDVDQLVTLPVPEMSRASRRAMQPESQVA
jgi:drug/metabolite transporter (DMT)-like permease